MMKQKKKLKQKKPFFRAMIPYLKPYKLHVFFLGVVMIMVGGIDATFALWTRYAVDNFIIPQATDGLETFIILFIGLVLWQGLNVFSLILLAGKLEMHLMYDLREETFRHLQHMELDYFNRTPGGWLLSRITSDIQRIGQTISWGFVDITWGFTTISGITLVMLILNWQLALITLSIVPFLIWISRYFQKRILKSQRLVRRGNSRVTASYNEALMGAVTTKTLVREQAAQAEFVHITKRMRTMSIRSAYFSALYQPVVLVFGALGTSFALWAGGLRINLDILTFGTLAAFLSYTVQLFDPLRELARVFSELQSARAAGERVFSVLALEPQILDTPEVIRTFGSILDPKPDQWPHMKGKIEFRNVSFTYPKGETILESFHLTIPSGQSVALVGATGSGKSTLVNLVCRFYEPNSGTILIDDRDYKEWGMAALQGNLGYVLQSPQLFSGSIFENIAFGVDNPSEHLVIDAAKTAHAHEFIIKLPEGYHTQVGEEGSLLSTGQKQLISFARAILANPAIIVLDEATSSIDTETEMLIQKAIHKVLENRTSLIIAHRLSTIKDADRILVIEKGKIKEEGNHKELMKKNGMYAQLYKNQFLHEEEETLGTRW